jgi:1-acyl-sn-glycerol-3-phosphate acyltransferase
LKKGEIVGVFPEATISQSFELKEMKNGVVRLAMESGAPILPTVMWGSQRVWTKNVKRDFRHRKYPIFVSIGEAITLKPDSDIEESMKLLEMRMRQLLSQLQNDYPDSPIGQRWAPARLGGTAPTPHEIEAGKNQRKEL